MMVVGVGFSIIFPIRDDDRVEDICAAIVMFLLLLLGYIETNWTIM
jgi:hypothetical protein